MHVKEKRLTENTRVEAFSDGVFAIALTLLILEIHLPHDLATNHDVYQALLKLWPSFLAFLVSFFAVLCMWYTHHDLMKLVRGVDKSFLFANGLLLLAVTFVPFPTAVLAEYLPTPACNAASAFYCGSYIVVSLAFYVFWRVISTNRRLIRNDVPDDLCHRITTAFTYGPLAYMVATLVSLKSAGLGLTLCCSLWILWLGLNYRPATPATE